MNNNRWLEEFRPKTLNDVIAQDKYVRVLKNIAKDIRRGIFDVSHMIFLGPPSVGKTSIVHAFLHDAFGDAYRSNFIEINSSDDRGIDVVRNKIKKYAKQSPIGTFTLDDGSLSPIPFNVIFLDEVDGVTNDAQDSLRRIMEVYPNTLFILAGNYPNKIIRPLKDRCAFSDMRFTYLTPEQLTTIIKSIVELKEIDIDSESIHLLSNNCGGSPRTAIHKLWLLSKINENAKITINDVKIIGMEKIDEKFVDSFINAIMSKEFEEVRKILDSLYYDYGFSGEQILSLLYENIDMIKDVKLKKNIVFNVAKGMHWCNDAVDDLIMAKAVIHRMILKEDLSL